MKKIKNLFLILICATLVFTPCYVQAEEPEDNSGNNNSTETTPENNNNNNNEENQPNEEENETEKEEENQPTQGEQEKTIKLNKTELSIETGNSTTLVATTTPEEAEVIWTSSDKTVATVEKGKITAIKEGKVTITAAIKDTDKKATCIVTITETASNDATLKKLEITNGKISPEFKPETDKYNITLNKGETTLKIKYELSNREAKYFGPSATDNKNLKNGDVLKIKVIAEDGTTNKTYTLTIIKEDDAEETSSDLKALKINGYTLNETFDSETTGYTASIPYEIETISITATPKDKNATVKTSNLTNLKVGKNTVTITVKDTDGNTKKYTIVVTREKEVTVEENETSIITSDNNSETTNKPSNNTNNTTPPKNEGNEDNFLKYAIVSLACLILFAIGGIGIYFYLKTSPKKLKKELDSIKKDEPKVAVVKEETHNNKNESINNIMQEDLIQTKEFDIVKEEKENLSDEKDV